MIGVPITKRSKFGHQVRRAAFSQDPAELQKLAENPDRISRREVALNTHTHKKTHIYLMKDEDIHVRIEARRIIRLKDPMRRK